MNTGYIVGFARGHNAGVCLLKDGEIVFALEEERITRIKHAAGFPINSIKFCLEFAKINLDQIDYILLMT